MKVGYIRVSSVDQNIQRQINLLTDYGCEKLFIDKESGKDLNRVEYKKMKKFVREKDIIVFAELDRLGRGTVRKMRIYNAKRISKTIPPFLTTLRKF